ncbi:hypothetical protein LXL04_004087 [Taraxacum kok-saghyz]
MTGPPSQGWSKFATKSNSGSTSDPKRKTLEKRPIEEASRIQKEKEQLRDLEEEIVNKERWIKKVEREIKTAVAAVNKHCFILDYEQDISKEMEDEYRKRNSWVNEEKYSL